MKRENFVKHFGTYPIGDLPIKRANYLNLSRSNNVVEQIKSGHYIYHDEIIEYLTCKYPVMASYPELGQCNNTKAHIIYTYHNSGQFGKMICSKCGRIIRYINKHERKLLCKHHNIVL